MNPVCSVGIQVVRCVRMVLRWIGCFCSVLGVMCCVLSVGIGLIFVSSVSLGFMCWRIFVFRVGFVVFVGPSGIVRGVWRGFICCRCWRCLGVSGVREGIRVCSVVNRGVLAVGRGFMCRRVIVRGVGWGFIVESVLRRFV